VMTLGLGDLAFVGSLGVPWTPANTTTALWLDAADASTITTDSGAVSEWRDKSGNARNLGQATPANRPAYTEAAINGRDAITFDGSSDFLSNAAVGLPVGASARSMFAVYKPAVTTGTNAICGQRPTSATIGTWFVLQFRTPLGDPYFAGIAADVGGGPSTITTSTKIAEIIYNGTTGTLFGTGNEYATQIRALNTGGNQFLVGANPVSGEFCNGIVAEVLFIGSAVSTDIRQRIEGYLAHKWGLTASLPAGHPYKTSAPIVESPTITDPDAAAYIAAVEFADGATLEPEVRTAIETFIVGCKTDGTWSAIKAACIMAGARTRLGAMVPLVGAAPTSFNFVDADYNRKTGLVGNGSTKYLNSNRNNNADPQDSHHLAAFATVAPQNGLFSRYIGVGAGTNGRSSLGYAAGGVSAQSRSRSNTVSTHSTGLTYPRFSGISRSASVNYVARVSGVNQTFTVASQTPTADPVLVFSGGVEFSDARLTFYSIGESLDLALLDARVTALMNAFAAAIP